MSKTQKTYAVKVHGVSDTAEIKGDSFVLDNQVLTIFNEGDIVAQFPSHSVIGVWDKTLGKFSYE